MLEIDRSKEGVMLELAYDYTEQVGISSDIIHHVPSEINEAIRM